MIHAIDDCGCGGDCGGRAVAPSVARVADPAAHKAVLYGVLAAGGWVFESKWAFAIGIGGLIGAVVDLMSNERQPGGG
jgi:hypothetical protein